MTVVDSVSAVLAAHKGLNYLKLSCLMPILLSPYLPLFGLLPLFDKSDSADEKLPYLTVDMASDFFRLRSFSELTNSLWVFEKFTLLVGESSSPFRRFCRFDDFLCV